MNTFQLRLWCYGLVCVYGLFEITAWYDESILVWFWPFVIVFIVLITNGNPKFSRDIASRQQLAKTIDQISERVTSGSFHNYQQVELAVQQVLDQANAERRDSGLSEIKVDIKLERVPDNE